MIKQLTHLAKKTYTLCMQLIAPAFCVACRLFLDDNTVLCDSCFAKLVPIVSTQITVSGQNMLTVLAISDYVEPLRSLILAKHYSQRVAAKQLAYLIWRLSNLQHISFDYLVPVPLHWTRYAWRGYNQAEIIAQELSRLSGKKVAYIIKRKRRTLFQSLFTPQQRTDNVKNAFELTKLANELYDNKTIVLVDDLITTGATLKSMAKEIGKLKPIRMYAVVACRVL